MTINLLPNELIIKIFSYLSLEDLAKRISLVSHSFKNLAFDPSLWTKLTKNISQLTVAQSNSLFTRCKMLTKLDLSTLHYSRAVSTATRAMKMCHRLKELTLEIKNDIEYLLEAISPSLEKLHLQGNWDPTKLTKGAKHLTRIQYLNLLIGDGLNSDDLVAIGQHCENLKRFIYVYDDGDDDSDDHPFNEALISFLDARKYTLQELGFQNTTITDIAFTGLAKCRNFHSLDISHSHYVTDVGIELIAGSCPNLINLNIHYCQNITDIGVDTIAKNCTKLARLDIGGCKITDFGVRNILRKCKTLEVLEMLDVQVTSLAFREVKVPSLRQLVLSECSCCGNYPEVLIEIKKLLLHVLIN